MRKTNKKRIHKRNKKRKTIKKGGGITTLNIPSLNIPSLSIENYNFKPKIIIKDGNPKQIYLITLTDPDAPAGTWTHYVAVIKPDGTVLSEPYKYEPPNPPSGTHRYIYNAYLVDKELGLTGTGLTGTGLTGTGLTGNEYYTKILAPMIKNKNPVTKPVQFSVKA
jgi:phosphatidylethanolamine-binding protein (PEBP) family uncharacterized protein